MARFIQKNRFCIITEESLWYDQIWMRRVIIWTKTMLSFLKGYCEHMVNTWMIWYILTFLKVTKTIPIDTVMISLKCIQNSHLFKKKGCHFAFLLFQWNQLKIEIFLYLSIHLPSLSLINILLNGNSYIPLNWFNQNNILIYIAKMILFRLNLLKIETYLYPD